MNFLWNGNMQMLHHSTKKDICDKTNYRPVSILSNISKIYEKIIYNQLYEYFNDKLFPNQYGFHKGYRSQQSLLVMTEKFKESTDEGNAFAALLTDLPKPLIALITHFRSLNSLHSEFDLYH